MCTDHTADPKACQDKENIPTATFKTETVVQGTSLDSQLLILVALKEMVTLIMTSVVAELNPAHWPGPFQGPPVNFSDLWQCSWVFSGFKRENSARTISLSHK